MPSLNAKSGLIHQLIVSLDAEKSEEEDGNHLLAGLEPKIPNSPRLQRTQLDTRSLEPLDNQLVLAEIFRLTNSMKHSTRLIQRGDDAFERSILGFLCRAESFSFLNEFSWPSCCSCTDCQDC